MSETKVKTVGGVDIFVTDTGKFRATVRGAVVEKTTLAAVEKTINVAPVEIDGMVSDYREQFRKVKISKLVKNRRKRYGQPEYLLADAAGNEYDKVYVPNEAFDQAVIDLKAIADASKTAHEAWRKASDRLDEERMKVMATLTCITADDLCK